LVFYKTSKTIIIKLRSSNGEEIPHYYTDGRFMYMYIFCMKGVYYDGWHKLNAGSSG